MPTFHFYKNGVKIESVESADHTVLQTKITELECSDNLLKTDILEQTPANGQGERQGSTINLKINIAAKITDKYSIGKILSTYPFEIRECVHNNTGF